MVDRAIATMFSKMVSVGPTGCDGLQALCRAFGGRGNGARFGLGAVSNSARWVRILRLRDPPLPFPPPPSWNCRLPPCVVWR